MKTTVVEQCIVYNIEVTLSEIVSSEVAACQKNSWPINSALSQSILCSLHVSLFSTNSKTELGIQCFFQLLQLFGRCEHHRPGQNITWYCFPLWNAFQVFLLFIQYLMVGFSPLAGLPDLIDKYWWIKSFFHSEPSPPTVGRKTLSASRWVLFLKWWG